MRLILSVLMLLLHLNATLQKVLVSGPGISPEKVVMPARYFFINFTSIDERNYSVSVAENLAIEITGKTDKKDYCRNWVNKLDRKDGTFIIRYKMYETCYDLSINIYYKSKHIEGSPFKIEGPVLSDQCNCPVKDYESWLKEYGCAKSYNQIDKDLQGFENIDMSEQIKKIIERYHRPESISFCHYVIKNNEPYRKCYGKHVGFNMFTDNILLSLARKVVLPDMELVMNLGDWPLIKKSVEKLPIFSWCGKDDSVDIVMPTYDITESTLENMGRVTLDMLSVQGSVARSWSQREARAVWRGRDSRLERLTLIDIARANPELFNASLTNFFFFKDKEAEYGPKQPHISFFKFFDYKYQINIDGTVAAYRFPYLMGGGGLVLKQESPYYEHFYHDLHPWVHYVPVSRDLSDLVERVKWAQTHDDEARKIAENARKYASENLLPQHIICYHAKLFWEWSKRLSSEVKIHEDMTHVPQTDHACGCSERKQSQRDEL